MAEVVKKKTNKKYNIERKGKEIKNKQVNDKKNNKKNNKAPEKENLITRIILFFKGVRSEVKKVHWLDRKSMVKYSIATIVFIIFCALFFYAIMSIFALVQGLLN